jgi:hypothetical protein
MQRYFITIATFTAGLCLGALLTFGSNAVADETPATKCASFLLKNPHIWNPKTASWELRYAKDIGEYALPPGYRAIGGSSSGDSPGVVACR